MFKQERLIFTFLNSFPLPYSLVSFFVYIISIGISCTYVSFNIVCRIRETGLTIEQCIRYIAHCGSVALAVAGIEVRLYFDFCTFLTGRRIIHRGDKLQVIGDQSFPDRTLAQMF